MHRLRIYQLTVHTLSHYLILYIVTGFTEMELIIIVVPIVGGVLLIALIVILVIFLVPSIRQRVFPHRDRTNFQAKNAHY